MNKTQIDISIIIPVYNGKDSLKELLNRINAVLNTKYSYEVLMIDDGSSDNSWNEILTLKTEHPVILKGVKLKKNYGQHNAIMCGFSIAQGKFLITMDDDLQHPPEEILKLVETQKANQADLVYGLPKDRMHNSAKKAGSYFIRKTSKYFADNPNGEGSSFRLIKKEIVDSILQNQTSNYIFIDEIIHWYTSDIALVDVDHHKRKFGKSGYSFFNLVKIYINIFINYTANPLKIMIYGGLFSSAITFIFGVRFILKKIFVDAPLGYTSIIVSILFSTSLIMFCLGIIGKYIYNLYQQKSGKPLYGIQKII
jgi:polyisoprenyl-phosphate glycosyltransferase